MPDYKALTPESHGQKRWKRFTSYRFASHVALVPVHAPEIARAALALPLAFAKDGDAYVPVAVLGIESGKCLFVAPDGGWLASYVPIALRAYPFSFAPTTDGHRVLAVDEASGLIVADGGEGEIFFDQFGKLGPDLNQIFEFLSINERSQGQTREACAALNAHGLIKPWPLTVRLPGGDIKVEGLFLADGAALDGVADDVFLDLRHKGALALAYAQIMSSLHMQALANLAKAQYERASQLEKLSGAGELDLGFMKSDTIRF